MTKRINDDLAKLRTAADLIYDRERTRFAAVRNQREKIDNAKSALNDEVKRMRSGRVDSPPQQSTVLRYIQLLESRIDELNMKSEAIQKDEVHQKQKLKNALATQIRLEKSNSV